MLRRLLSITAAFLLALSFSPKIFAADNDKVHYIKYPDDIKLLQQYPNDTFYLVNDIYLSVPWQISCPTPDKPFSGVLDGQGYSICYVKINSDAEAVAFFGYLTGTIKSLTISRAEIKATTDNATVAGLVAYNNGTISDCKFDGDICRGDEKFYGVGICAVNNGNVQNCIDKTDKSDVLSSSSTVIETSPGKPIDESKPPYSSSSNTSSTLSIITQIDYNNSSKESSSSEVAESDRENAVDYFDELNSKPKERASGAVTIIVCSIAAVALIAVFTGSLYQEMKAKKREKQKEETENKKNEQ